MTASRDLPTVPRLAAVATVVYGLAMLIFAGLVFWVAATTGEPVVLDPHRWGEAHFEAVVFAVIMGVACYGMATLDWLLRRRVDRERESTKRRREVRLRARPPVRVHDGGSGETFVINGRHVDPRSNGVPDGDASDRPRDDVVGDGRG